MVGSVGFYRFRFFSVFTKKSNSAAYKLLHARFVLQTGWYSQTGRFCFSCFNLLVSHNSCLISGFIYDFRTFWFWETKLVLDYDFLFDPAGCFRNYYEQRDEPTPLKVYLLYVYVLGFYIQALYSCAAIGQKLLITWKLSDLVFIIFFRWKTKRYWRYDGTSSFHNIFGLIFTWNAILGHWGFSPFLSWYLWYFSRFGKNFCLYAESDTVLKSLRNYLRSWKNSRIYYFCCQLGYFSISFVS